MRMLFSRAFAASPVRRFKKPLTRPPLCSQSKVLIPYFNGYLILTNYEDGESESLMGSEAARKHVFPMLLTELVKEQIIDKQAAESLQKLFDKGNREIKTALDVYDKENDMASLVNSLKNISVHN